jgi:hypothetical protein
MWAESTVGAIRTACDELAGWQSVRARRLGAGVVMGVALAHAWSAAWSTAVPTVGASPGTGCGISGPCDAAMFHANAKTTPTSTGPTVETSPIRPRLPRSPRGLDPRCAASPLGTGGSIPSSRIHTHSRHQKVITQLRSAWHYMKYPTESHCIYYSCCFLVCDRAAAQCGTWLSCLRLRSCAAGWSRSPGGWRNARWRLAVD